MSKSASENYLDQLLNSVHDSDDHVQEAQKPLDPQEKLERDILQGAGYCKKGRRIFA